MANRIHLPEISSATEREIIRYTNAQRKRYGLLDLRYDPKLSEIALEHSLDMALGGFFSHMNTTGEDPHDRARRHGYNIRKKMGFGRYREGVSENIGKMPVGIVRGVGFVNEDPSSLAEAHVDSWMESEGHRKNILDRECDLVGVGVAFDGTYYIATQNFF